MSAARVHLAACVAALVFFAVYVGPLWGVGVELWYLPLDHRWVLGPKPTGLAMDWFGRTLFALLAGGGAAAIALVATRGSGARDVRRAWAIVVAAALIAVLAAYAATLRGRQPGPVMTPTSSWSRSVVWSAHG